MAPSGLDHIRATGPRLAPHHRGVLHDKLAALSIASAEVFTAAAVWAVGGLVAASPAGASTLVPLTQKFRACDFTPAVNMQSRGHGTARAVIGTGANQTVTAHVQLVAVEPGVRYNVRLIQAPASSVSCTAGVTDGTMETDGAGTATLTLRDALSPNTTGAWVFVERPSPNSQTPAEYYTSEFIAALREGQAGPLTPILGTVRGDRSVDG